MADFLSVPLWCAYIQVRLPEVVVSSTHRVTRPPLLRQFLQAVDAPHSEVREVCERAVVAGGLHFWQVCPPGHPTSSPLTHSTCRAI